MDICVTGLIKNHDPFMPHFGSRKWSTVIGLDYFDRVRDLANTVFVYMDVRGHYVPEIVRHGVDGIAMSWTDDETRIVTIILDPGKFSYRWGKQGCSLPTYNKETQNMPGMLDLFSKYLNGTIEIKHNVGLISMTAGPTAPFNHDNDLECGCGKS